MKAFRTAALAAALGLVFGGASAATVNLTGITGTWFDANPAGNITSNTGGGTASTSIRWGASGYDFGAVASASGVVPPSPSPNFALGTFTHVNQVIAPGTSITDVKLRVNADIDVDGTPIGNRAFEFQFTHNETPNGDDPCADGNPNGVGVNVNGCADIVTVGFLTASESFFVGTDLYTVNIVGFDAGAGLVTQFFTAEQLNNSARLLANVVLRDSLQVPEPGSVALVGAALFGLMGVRRRLS